MSGYFQSFLENSEGGADSRTRRPKRSNRAAGTKVLLSGLGMKPNLALQAVSPRSSLSSGPSSPRSNFSSPRSDNSKYNSEEILLVKDDELASRRWEAASKRNRFISLLDHGATIAQKQVKLH